MGVRNLWQILGPYGDKISVTQLQGKQIAVDLSAWICENQVVGVKHRSRQPKLHLRNIFFRATVLLLSNVTPIFILDGVAPEIKKSTLAKRNQARLNHGKSEEVEDESLCPNDKKVERKILKYTLRECEEMLNSLGLCCLWSVGEGEAFCALLDNKGVVDGVISQDGDTFLYGANKVYRNFTAQCGFGSVEVFEMSTLQKKLNLSREKLIAMSLFCGCDYDETGIHGIGPETALKYLSNFKGDILQRLQSLKTDESLQKYECEKEYCKKCQHPRNKQDHTKHGCKLCGTERKCVQSQTNCSYDCLSNEEKAEVDFELKLLKKIKLKTTFPDKATINEYLNFQQEIPKINFTWGKPNIVKFLQFMSNKCNWSLSYGFEKVMPLYCRWALINSDFNAFYPSKILKKRVLKGVPSFDLQWISQLDLNLYFCDNERNILNIDSFNTIEPQALVREKCRNLYDIFITEMENKKRVKKKNGKKGLGKEKDSNLDVDGLIESVGQLSLVNDKSTESTKDIKKKPKEKSLQKKSNEVKSSASKISDKENIESDHDAFFKNSLSNISLEDIEERCYETGLDMDDSRTVEYNISEYEIDESFILNNIIARRQYY